MLWRAGSKPIHFTFNQASIISSIPVINLSFFAVMVALIITPNQPELSMLKGPVEIFDNTTLREAFLKYFSVLDTPGKVILWRLIEKDREDGTNKTMKLLEDWLYGSEKIPVSDFMSYDEAQRVAYDSEPPDVKDAPHRVNMNRRELIKVGIASILGTVGLLAIDKEIMRGFNYWIDTSDSPPEQKEQKKKVGEILQKTNMPYLSVIGGMATGVVTITSIRNHGSRAAIMLDQAIEYINDSFEFRGRLAG